MKIQIHDKNGDISLQSMTVQEARIQLTQLLRKGWVFAVNGVMTRDVNKVVDNTEVRIYLVAGGG